MSEEISLSELNRLLARPEETVREAERLYGETVLSLAARIAEKGRLRLVLLAGPSGSGKTTTANLLADALRAKGRPARVLSLDDFYRNATDPAYPRMPNGERDFEAVEALHLPDLARSLGAIARGENYFYPHFDFKTGMRASQKKEEYVPGSVVIIEGLHALNPLVFGSLPAENIFKLYVSVSTNMMENGERLISGRRARFLRRLVRDHLYRNATAERTLGLWEHVLEAEDLYVYPFRDNADLWINTYHTFELGVMKPFAEKLLTDEVCAKSAYAAKTRRGLAKVTPLSAAIVPETSLIREFIPGGVYEHLY